jgi:hypothetical protein
MTLPFPAVFPGCFCCLDFIFCIHLNNIYGFSREYYRGTYHCTVDVLFDWFGISCMSTANFCFYMQNRPIQTGQTGGQQYSDTSPFSTPWLGSVSSL